MAGITRDQRARAWNITFYLGKTPFAGIYQCDDCLTIANVARDLDLCLVFHTRPADDDLEAVLLPRRDDATPVEHIPLDQTNTDTFPAPTTAAHYTYLLHSSSRCAVPDGQPHSRDSDCYQQPPLPARRYDPRYVPIGKQPARAGRTFMAPLRNTKGTKRSVSGSRNPSTSSTQSEIDNEEIPVSVISPETARTKINTFRSNVLSNGHTACAISGKGRSWLEGLAGTGVEAAHIIPQIHWAVYPLGDLVLTNVDEKAQLEIAWRRTWMPSNGLPLLSHIHKCFEARLVTIHPQTHRVRAFVDYDVLAEYNGRQAHLPAALDVDAHALQHQYDMCCIENMVASWVPDEPVPLVTSNDQALLMAPPQASSGGSATDKGPTAGSAPNPAIAVWQQSISQNSSTPGHTTHPPSPPTSSTGRIWWLCGAEVIQDPQEAENLRQQGWILYEVSSDEEQRNLLSRRRWFLGDEILNDPEEARNLQKQGWPLQEVRVGSEDEYRLLASLGRKIWLYNSEIVDDPEEARALLDLGYPLHEVQRYSKYEVYGDKDERGRPSKKRRCTASLEEPPGKKRQLAIADLSPESSFI